MLRCRRAPLDTQPVLSFLVDRSAANTVAQSKMHDAGPSPEMQALVAVQKKDKGRDGQSALQLLTLRALAQLVTELTIRSKSADNPLRGAVCLQRFVPPVGVRASVVRVHGRHGPTPDGPAKWLRGWSISAGRRMPRTAPDEADLAKPEVLAALLTWLGLAQP